MVFLDFIICRNGGEEKVQELLLPLLLPVLRSQVPCQEPGNVALLRALGFLCLPSLPFSSQGIIPSGWKAEEWEGAGKNWFLSCSRVTGFLQLSVYSEIYSCNSSCPVFIIHILPSSWLFVTTPSLPSGWKHFHFFAVLLVCFLMLCSTWNRDPLGRGRIQTCTTVHCLKPLTRRKTEYLISLAERS